MLRIFFVIAFYFNFTACAVAPKNKNSETESSDNLPSKLLSPNVKKIWIAPIIKDNGNEWEAGHYLYEPRRINSKKSSHEISVESVTIKESTPLIPKI